MVSQQESVASLAGHQARAGNARASDVEDSDHHKVAQFATEVIMPSPLPSEEGDVFMFKVVKQSNEEKMGIIPAKGQLVVMQVTKDGAVHRTNMENAAKGEPVLQVDDAILKVNSVEDGNHQMVSECCAKNELIMQVFRPKQGSSSASTSCASSVSSGESHNLPVPEEPDPELRQLRHACNTPLHCRSAIRCQAGDHLRLRTLMLGPVFQSRVA